MKSSTKDQAKGKFHQVKGKLKEMVRADACRLLAKHLQVESEYTRALEAILGPAVDAVLLDDPAKAAGVADQLEAKKLGGVCLHVPAPEVAAENGGKKPLPKIPKTRPPNIKRIPTRI